MEDVKNGIYPLTGSISILDSQSPEFNIKSLRSLRSRPASGQQDEAALPAVSGRGQGGAGECRRGEQKNSLYAGDFNISFRTLTCSHYEPFPV